MLSVRIRPGLPVFNVRDDLDYSKSKKVKSSKTEEKPAKAFFY